MRRPWAALLIVLCATTAARAEDSAAEPRRATLYAFFATWCVPCRVEIPHIERLHRDYAARGLEVVLVSEDAPSTAQNIPAFLARYDVTARWILDSDSELLERYNAQANVPFTVVLDASGSVVYAHAGYEPGDERAIEEAVVEALGTQPAAAPQPRLTSTSQGLGVYRTSRFDPVETNDGLLRAAVGRIEVAGYTEAYSAAVRVDGAWVDDEVAGKDGDARPERASLIAENGPLRVTIGDAYAQFGHGVSLSLRKVDPLGVDTTLRGARSVVNQQGVKTTVLGGWTNPQNLDPIELRVVDQDNDFIAGGEVTTEIAPGVRAGPYALLVRADEAGGGGENVQWMLGGASATAKLGDLRLALEAAGGRREGMALADETPWAGYASAQWTAGPVTALLDAKAYRHWRIGRGAGSLVYHEPPTLEREDQEVPGNEDAVGARTRVEYRLASSATVFGNALAYQYSQDDSSPLSNKTALHVYAGGEKRFEGGASTSIAGGVRREIDDDGSTSLELYHADVDASVEVLRGLALTVKWNHREEIKFDTFDPLEFRRGLAVVGLSWAGVGAISALYGYSTERATDPTHYPGGELLVHLPGGGFVRLFLGQLTGGRVCVSGSCRDVPPFRGGRLDLVFRR